MTVSAETTVSTLAPGGLNTGGRQGKENEDALVRQHRGVLPGSGLILGGLHMVQAIPAKVSPQSCAVTGVFVERISGDLRANFCSD